MIAGTAAPLRAIVWAMPTRPPCDVTPSAPTALAGALTRRRKWLPDTPNTDPCAAAYRDEQGGPDDLRGEHPAGA